MTLRHALWLVPIGWLLYMLLWGVLGLASMWSGQWAEAARGLALWMALFGGPPAFLGFLIAWIVNRRKPVPMTYPHASDASAPDGS